jgi:hypothetical protein
MAKFMLSWRGISLTFLSSRRPSSAATWRPTGKGGRDNATSYKASTADHGHRSPERVKRVDFESVMVMSACPQPSDYSLVDQGWFSRRTLHRRRHDWSANTSGKCLARKAQNKSTRWSRTTSICEVV